MTTKPQVLILSGLPASGKSTHAKQWVSEDPDARIRINYDDMRLAWFGPEWKFNRKDEDRIKAAAKDQVCKAINAGLSVVIDNTNLSANVRRGWEVLAKSLGAEVIEHELDTPAYLCVQRDLARKDRAGGRVGRAVIERMALFYGLIDWSEYPDEFVIVDLDGTVADCQHRLGYLTPTIKAHKLDCTAIVTTHESGRCPQCGVKATKDWVAFHADDEIAKDTPYSRMVDLVWFLLEAGHNILFITGRGTESGIATEEWLYKHFQFFRTSTRCHLFMRQGADHRPDTEIKKEILDLLPKNRIAYVLEDRDRVVEMYRAEGLTVLQPKKGDY